MNKVLRNGSSIINISGIGSQLGFLIQVICQAKQVWTD